MHSLRVEGKNDPVVGTTLINKDLQEKAEPMDRWFLRQIRSVSEVLSTYSRSKKYER
jgi:hypothetical protein